MSLTIEISNKETLLKLGDIREYHSSDIPQSLNVTSTTISLRFKFNSRRERVLWLIQKKGNLFLFIKSNNPVKHNSTTKFVQRSACR